MVKESNRENGARVLQIQNWFHRKSKGRQCKGRQPRNFDFLQLTLIAHWVCMQCRARARLTGEKRNNVAQLVNYSGGKTVRLIGSG